MALRKESERRYPSVEEFSEDICRHLGGPACNRPEMRAVLSQHEIHQKEQGYLHRGRADRRDPRDRRYRALAPHGP